MKGVVSLSMLGLAILGALVLLAVREEPARPAPADYNTGTALPGGKLCLVDETNGFPVEQAAREFDGLVDVTVGDCADAENVAVVRTVTRGEDWSGWFNGPNDERDHAVISLNLAQAYRIDPAMWRTVLVHEIAHAVGLEHTYEGDSIMHPLTGAATHDGLTDQDRAQIEALYESTP